MLNHKYNHVVIGGTMDAFHKGHKDYIDMALSIAENVTIYLNHEKFVKNNKNYKVKPVSQRIETVKKYIESCGSLNNTQIVEVKSIDDICKLYIDPEIDSILVLGDRTELPSRLNTRRNVPLSIIVKERTLSSKGEDISSTSIYNK